MPASSASASKTMPMRLPALLPLRCPSWMRNEPKSGFGGVDVVAMRGLDPPIREPMPVVRADDNKCYPGRGRAAICEYCSLWEGISLGEGAREPETRVGTVEVEAIQPSFPFPVAYTF